MNPPDVKDPHRPRTTCSFLHAPCSMLHPPLQKLLINRIRHDHHFPRNCGRLRLHRVGHRPRHSSQRCALIVKAPLIFRKSLQTGDYITDGRFQPRQNRRHPEIIRHHHIARRHMPRRLQRIKQALHQIPFDRRALRVTTPPHIADPIHCLFGRLTGKLPRKNRHFMPPLGKLPCQPLPQPLHRAPANRRNRKNRTCSNGDFHTNNVSWQQSVVSWLSLAFRALGFFVSWSFGH